MNLYSVVDIPVLLFGMNFALKLVRRALSMHLPLSSAQRDKLSAANAEATSRAGVPSSHDPGQVHPIRVLLVSDLPLIRASVRCVLEHAGITRVTEAGTCRDTVDPGSERPDVVIVDLMCDGVRDLALPGDEYRIIALGMRGCPWIHKTATEIGALALVLTDEPSDALVETVWNVYGRESWLDRRTTPYVLCEARRVRREHDEDVDKIATLTARELEIISCIGEGLQHKAIAHRLLIKEATVRNHLTSILSKLELTDRFELVVYAFKRRLISYTGPRAIEGSAAPSVRGGSSPAGK